MFESNDQTFPSGVGRLGRATGKALNPSLEARNSQLDRPVGVTVDSPMPPRQPGAVTIVVVCDVVGMCAALWFWVAMVTYAGELDRFSPDLYSGAETTRSIVSTFLWGLPIVLVLNIILVGGLCML